MSSAGSFGGVFLPVFIGALILIYVTFRAVLDRENPRRLILWGGLHDLAVCIIAFCAPTAEGLTGLTLYFIFQLCARVLAWTALEKLESAALPGNSSSGTLSDFINNLVRKGLPVTKLAGMRNILPWSGAMFGFGLLATVGGSPFLLPEGRALIISGMLETTNLGGFLCMLLMAAATTVFIWLYVETVRQICLEKSAPDISGSHEEKFSGMGAPTLVAAIIVACLGLFRAPFTDLTGLPFGLDLMHSPVQCSYWVYYIGAFITGLAFLLKLRWAPILGTAFFALGFIVICLLPQGPLANLFLLLIGLIGFMVAIYSISYIKSGRAGWYWFFLLLTFAALAGIVSTPQVTSLYAYWELMTYASYFLVVYEKNAKAFSAGLKYYVMCAGGAVFMLPGLMALGIFSVEPSMALHFPFWLKTSIILCLIGFGAKAGLVPLHAWLPEAHPAAPSSISAPLSGIITKMGIFGLINVILIGIGPAEREINGAFGLTWFGLWLCIIGAATMIYGEIMALCQSDIKKMLAYSTMGQIGEVVLVLSLGTWLATAGSLWHIINHAIMKDLLFLAGGALIMRAGSRELSDLKGMGQQMPVTVACMGVGLVSIMGLPPFGAFYGKFMMIQASIDAGYIWVAVMLLAAALVGAIYYTRILKTLILEKRPADLPALEEAPFSMRLAMIILASICVLLGLVPQLVVPLVVPAASLCFSMPENALAVLQAINVNWPVYVIFPIFGAVLPAIFRGNPRMSGWMSVGVLLLTAVLVIIFGRNLDTLSFCFALIVTIIGAINMAYAVGYMSHSTSQWRFYCAFTCMCGGLVGLAASRQLLGFFLFWEIMSSWALYLAISHEGTKAALAEGFKYFLFNLFGGSFLFIGLAITGASLPFNAGLLGGINTGITSYAAWWGMALLAIGFALKAAQLPFRIDWQMHPALAPTPVSGYISSVLLKSAIIGLIKLFMLIGGGYLLSGILTSFSENIISTTVMWIGGITIIMAAWQALMANGLKLVFIYSTVSQLGYMVLAIACGTSLGYAGGMLHLVNHVFFKDLLFLVCGAVMFTTHMETLNELGGIGRKMPFTLLMFAIGGLSLVGVPPTSGFSSKWIIYQALMQAGQPFLALLSLVGSVITLAYVAKFLHAAFLGQSARDLAEVKEAPLVMRVTMGLLALGCLLTGIFPGLALYPINAIITQYGSQQLQVGLSGLVSGHGAWNATAIFIMMSIAFLGGFWFVRHFTRLREVDVHSCGLPPESSTSRMTPASIYGDIIKILSGNAARENRQ